MLYDFIKPIVKIFYPTYYTFMIKGKEKIPTDQPVVLACNHTNAFVDPIIFAMLLKQRVRFYARGDVFKEGAVAWFLNQVNMSPIYRAGDGFNDAKTKNERIFEECRERLHNNETLLLYPEGICVQEKRLVPLKKGLGRILFHEGDTRLKKDVLVIPIGINYSNAKKFRSKVLINIGEPFSIFEFKEEVAKNGTNLVNEFTSFLEKKMRDLIITIDHKENDDLIEIITEIYIDQILDERKLKTNNMDDHFFVRKEIANIINYLAHNQPDRMEMLKIDVNEYIDDINDYQLRDHLIRPETIEKSKAFDFVIEFFTLWIGLPIYGVGLLTNYLPYYLPKQLTIKKNIKKEFVASIHLNIAMFAWLLFYAIQLIVIGLVFRNWIVLGLFAVIVPLLGIYNLQFYPRMKKILGRWKLLRMARKDRNAVAKLMQDRAKIITELNLARKEYHER